MDEKSAPNTSKEKLRVLSKLLLLNNA